MEEYSIIWRDIAIHIKGDYEPEERMVMYYKDGTGYPGSPSYFDFTDILIGNQSIYNILSSEQLDEIRSIIIVKIEEGYEMEN